MKRCDNSYRGSNITRTFPVMMLLLQYVNIFISIKYFKKVSINVSLIIQTIFHPKNIFRQWWFIGGCLGFSGRAPLSWSLAFSLVLFGDKSLIVSVRSSYSTFVFSVEIAQCEASVGRSYAVFWFLTDGFSGFFGKRLWSYSSIAFGLWVVDCQPSSSSASRGVRYVFS